MILPAWLMIYNTEERQVDWFRDPSCDVCVVGSGPDRHILLPAPSQGAVGLSDSSREAGKTHPKSPKKFMKAMSWGENTGPSI